MKHISAIILTASLVITNSAFADPDLDDLLEQAKAKLDQASKYDAGVNLSAISINGKGTITYKGKEVWKGRVKNDELTAIGKVGNISENGEQKNSEDYEQENTELAAVWDGDKLIWENRSGAGAALEPERKKLKLESERRKQELENPKR